MERILDPGFRRLVRRGRRTAVRLVGWGIAGQLGLAAAVVAVDEVRKRRSPRAEQQAPADDPRGATVGQDDITTYTYGEILYDDMVAEIDASEHFVYLASFIWKSDEVGHRFKDAVVRAADRGVLVCVVYDGFANLVVPPSFKRFPAGVHVLKFPVVRAGIPLLDVRRSGRDHRKILVVDGTVGFVGGYNIGALYATRWRDTHLRVRGPSVWELQNAFVDFWNRHRGQGLPQLPDSGSPHWNPSVHAARNEPSRLIYPVRALYLEAIDRAQHRIWITQGYFIPDKEILEGLLRAAERGVDVRVVLPERSNHVLADVVARSYWATLLEGGVHLHLYRNVMVHAKTATVDGQWATVGTANIDRLSLRGNYEINLEIIDPAQAERMEEIFQRDLEACRELTLAEWQERPRHYALVERALRPLGHLL